ncbi:MAG: hypothetical protein JWR48_7369 [Mycobacterium sp.]|jgi:hypothetical protein|nr:hypothetical protein [Mycobacterium sp.]
MLMRNGVDVLPSNTGDHELPQCHDLVDQIRGRFLLKYIRWRDRNRYSVSSGISHFDGMHFLTPTVLCTDTVVPTLNLPTYLPVPKYALIIDPEEVVAHGPRRIRGGGGAVEYLLLNGFDFDAIVPPPWPREIK